MGVCLERSSVIAVSLASSRSMRHRSRALARSAASQVGQVGSLIRIKGAILEKIE